MKRTILSRYVVAMKSPSKKALALCHVRGHDPPLVMGYQGRRAQILNFCFCLLGYILSTLKRPRCGLGM